MRLWRSYRAKYLIANGRLVLCFLVGLLLGQACSPLRNLKKNRVSRETVSDSSLHMHQVEKSQEQATSLHMMRGRDSLDARFRIQIWPKGSFSYDPLSGFQGEAAKIEILGRELQRSSLESTEYGSSSKAQQAHARLDVDQHHRALDKAHTLQRAVSWKTVLGYLLVAFCLLAAFLLFRGIRNWRLR